MDILGFRVYFVVLIWDSNKKYVACTIVETWFVHRLSSSFTYETCSRTKEEQRERERWLENMIRLLYIITDKSLIIVEWLKPKGSRETQIL